MTSPFFSRRVSCRPQMVVRHTTGECDETMKRKAWDVHGYVGRRARVKLVDFSSGSWGHINFDDLKGDISCS
ncbi:hypothetical protein P5673_003213 [Acropora cervicornis]|uniref:Uncharacterized protein n=1 Tax=Acropora cervicornis TaxID=6130 RepID=A0AAD9R2H7_ACRCE|nr:hypothetical protein P5673_003213 [Acropora cervicornis]